MSAKFAKRSKVSVNNEMSSEEEIGSDLDIFDANEELSDGPNGDEDMDADSGGMATNNSWADAMNKVLSINIKKKSFILSKAKKDNERKEKGSEQTNSLEIVRSDGTVETTSDKTKKSIEKVDKNEKKKNKLSKNEWEVMNKLKPKPEDREHERMLCSIATKGVVQLFNAVREQQKTIDSKLNDIKSETKRDKMLNQFNKNQFLDKLKANETSNKDKKANDSSKAGPEDQKWKVLRDDFMIGAKMKDWDKESDSDDN